MSMWFCRTRALASAWVLLQSLSSRLGRQAAQLWHEQQSAKKILRQTSWYVDDLTFCSEGSEDSRNALRL